MDINKPHDSFFKELMSDPDNLGDFLRNFTPKALAPRIDYDSIQVAPFRVRS